MASVDLPIEPIRTSASEDFHEASSLRETDWTLARAIWSVNNVPEVRRVVARPAPPYPSAPETALPPPDLKASASFEDVLCRRESVRAYSGAPLLLSDLSTVLWFSVAVTRSVKDEFGIEWGY